MALFKIYRGDKEKLPKEITDGYAYFIKDEAKLYIDAGSTRYCLNAEGAGKVLKGSDYVETNNLVFKDQIIDVEHGGTGVKELTKGAILVGNGTEVVQLVTIPENGVVVYDAENGIKGLTGTGVLQTGDDGVPKFDILPLKLGGTEATDAENARKNLQVYSTGEIDEKFTKAISVAYETTLSTSDWQESGLEDENKKYSCIYNNTSLTCGKEGKVPPIITYTSNLEEYSTIDSASAQAGVGITFYAKEKPEGDIGLIIIDVM